MNHTASRSDPFDALDCPTSHPDPTITCPKCQISITLPVGLAELDKYQCICSNIIDLNEALRNTSDVTDVSELLTIQGKRRREMAIQIPPPANYGPPVCIHNLAIDEGCTKCAVELLTRAVRLLLKRHRGEAEHEWPHTDHKELTEITKGLAALP